VGETEKNERYDGAREGVNATRQSLYTEIWIVLALLAVAGVLLVTALAGAVVSLVRSRRRSGVSRGATASP
jgi:uncharacterized membrane protein